MTTTLAPEAFLVAIASLPGVGPARMSGLLERWAPEDAWRALGRGGSPTAAIAGSVDLANRWKVEVSNLDPASVWERYRLAGVGVLGWNSPAFPLALRADPERPAVLFTLGNPARCPDRAVAIVGTRKCTRYGIDVAYELGHMLASEGVCVVSGLARGIDAAAHRGAIDAGSTAPLAVVGTAVDSPYPRENAELWQRVAEAGMVCGEAPLGAGLERWRFPARNRIVAGLAQITVVVESHSAGGSLYTAAQAMERGRTVLAVPGPIRSSSSAGCNQLIADGCHPLCELDDVLVALGLTTSGLPGPAPLPATPIEMQVLDAVGWQPVGLDEILAAVGLDLETTATTVERLRSRGLLSARGPWLERAAVEVTPAGPDDPENTHAERPRPRGAS